MRVSQISYPVVCEAVTVDDGVADDRVVQSMPLLNPGVGTAYNGVSDYAAVLSSD
jgi:hypothetical protein